MIKRLTSLLFVLWMVLLMPAVKASANAVQEAGEQTAYESIAVYSDDEYYVEAEPNDDLATANLIMHDYLVAGQLSGNDLDCYIFEIGETPDRYSTMILSVAATTGTLEFAVIDCTDNTYVIHTGTSGYDESAGAYMYEFSDYYLESGVYAIVFADPASEDTVYLFHANIPGNQYCRHDYGEGNVTNAVTCDKNGTITYTCSRCSKQKTEEIQAQGHKFENGQCTVCKIMSNAIIAQGKHDFGPTQWKITADGVLTLFGGQRMQAKTEYEWDVYAHMITGVVANDVVRIPEGAFDSYPELQWVSLSNTVTYIDRMAFVNCKKLNDISIPSSVTQIGVSAFEGCSALKELNIAADSKLTKLGENALRGTGITKYTLPTGITEVPAYAFADCYFLTEVVLPEGVTKVDNYAFANCSALKTLTLPSTLVDFRANAFDGCTGVESMVIFSNCRIDGMIPYQESLTSVVFGDTVKIVPQATFENCKNLVNVTLNAGLETIGRSAFEGCSALTNITLPEGITMIEHSAFWNSGISEIVIPDSVTSIALWAFYDCGNLESIRFMGDAPEMAMNIFGGVAATAYYPAGNPTWTEAAMQNYGGTITWVPYEVDDHVHEYEAVVTAPTYTEHGYTTHICECGESYVDTYTEPLALPAANIELARMILGNELAMQFAFKAAPIVDGIDYVVSITKSYANREDVVVTVPQRQWKTQNVGGQPYYIVSFNGIAAKEMGDSIRVQVKTADGTPVGDIYTNSVSNYAVTQLRKTTDAKTRALYVDMLNYGAAAQSYFGYDAENLVTAELTETEKGYGTQEVKLENNLVKGPGYVASQLDLGSSILLRVKFNGIDSSMYAVVSFTSHTGTQKTVTIPGSEFISGGTVVVIDDVVAADYNQDVTITVHDASGSTVASAVESVASYISRMSSGNEIYSAVAKYCVAAYGYLHK